MLLFLIGFNGSRFGDNRVTLFSLAYPLDEVCPVAINVGNVQVLNNRNFKVVYTNENPSICMIYDQQNRQHSVFLIRKVNNGEKMELANRIDATYPSTVGLSNKVFYCCL